MSNPDHRSIYALAKLNNGILFDRASSPSVTFIIYTTVMRFVYQKFFLWTLLSSTLGTPLYLCVSSVKNFLGIIEEWFYNRKFLNDNFLWNEWVLQNRVSNRNICRFSFCLVAPLNLFIFCRRFIFLHTQAASPLQ